MVADLDLEEKFLQFSSRADRDVISAQVRARRVAKKVAEQVGCPVLIPPQVRLMAYVLGYDDPSAKDDVIGVTAPTHWRVIKPSIPLDGVVDLSTIRLGSNTSRYYREAYKVPAVEEAFKILGLAGKLDYSPERFREVLERV